MIDKVTVLYILYSTTFPHSPPGMTDLDDFHPWFSSRKSCLQDNCEEITLKFSSACTILLQPYYTHILHDSQTTKHKQLKIIYVSSSHIDILTKAIQWVICRCKFDTYNILNLFTMFTNEVITCIGGSTYT